MKEGAVAGIHVWWRIGTALKRLFLLALRLAVQRKVTPQARADLANVDS